MNADRKPIISVIVTAYNIAEYIAYAVDSVLEQGYDRHELIVVDDGSDDSTLLKALDRIKSHHDYKLITQSNKNGPGGTRNIGIRIARGEYVLFLDGDDWLAAGALRTLANACQNGPDAIFSNRIWYLEAGGHYREERTFTHHSVGPVTEKRQLMARFAVTGKLFRRRFLTANKIFFPEGMIWEDYPFSYMVLSRAKTISVISDITYVARKRHGANASLTQRNRLSAFNLDSRFRQIQLNREIVATTDLWRKFPRLDFDKIDFERRLMVDVKYLMRENNNEILSRAFTMLRGFLRDEQTIWRRCVTPGVAAVYEAIVGDDMAECIRILAHLEKK